MVYFFLISILVVYSFSYITQTSCNRILIKKSRYELYFFLFCVISLSFIAAFRYKTGRDWVGYIRIFDLSLNSTNQLKGYELGFVLLNHFFKTIFNDFYLMQFCIVVFSSSLIYRNFYQKSLFPVFTILLYVFRFYFQTDMAQTRQYIAMAILAYGMVFIQRKQIVKWILIVILATSFHITAMVAFPLYFTTRVILKRKICWLLFCLYIVVYIWGLDFVRGILSVVINLPFVPSRIVSIGISYLNSTIYGQQGQFNSGLGFLTNIFFIIYMLITFCRKDCKKEEFYMCNFFVGLFFYAMGRNFDQFSRLANYYMICGCGLCGYNLIIGNRSFFKQLDFIRVMISFLFIMFEVYTFQRNWFSISPTLNTSYHLDYVPWKNFLLNK